MRRDRRESYLEGKWLEDIDDKPDLGACQLEYQKHGLRRKLRLPHRGDQVYHRQLPAYQPSPEPALAPRRQRKHRGRYVKYSDSRPRRLKIRATKLTDRKSVV